MRDPVLYRIRHVHHQRTGDTWCIYPMYDYAHPISDVFFPLEYVTHFFMHFRFSKIIDPYMIGLLKIPQFQLNQFRLNLHA